jgi:hypothetical protein
MSICGLPRSAEQARFLLPWAWSLLRRSDALRDRAPWIVYAARAHVMSRLARGDRVFEYGSGGSTLWFADQGCEVVSVEHDFAWHHRVVDKLEGHERARVTCLLALPEPARDASEPAENGFGSEDDRYKGLSFENYVSTIDSHADESLDIVLVDGRARSACLLRSWPKVRKGGLLVLDDSDRDRYQAAMERLPRDHRHDYFGPAAYSRWYWRTTIWEKHA